HHFIRLGTAGETRRRMRGLARRGFVSTPAVRGAGPRSAARRPPGRFAVEALERRVLLDGTVVCTEIMYHPAGSEDALEWVELHNQMAVDVDVSGWTVHGGIDYTFPQGSVLRGSGYSVVAINPNALQVATGYAGAFGPFA